MLSGLKLWRKSTVLKSKSKHKHSWPHGKNVMPLSLVLIACLVMLSGCASKQQMPDVDCPQPVPIPASLSESRSSEVQNLSKEVRSYLTDVSDWLKELR